MSNQANPRKLRVLMEDAAVAETPASGTAKSLALYQQQQRGSTLSAKEQQERDDQARHPHGGGLGLWSM